MDAAPESPRDFQIEFSTDQGCLRAYVTGRNGSLENTLAYWREIAAEMRRVHPEMLLVVDVMHGGAPPPEHLLAFVQAMGDEDLHGLKIAYVEDKYEILPQVELAGIYAMEHGFDVQIFQDEDTAARWLRYGAH